MICPFCKEEIKDGAIKCKHCGSMLYNSYNSKPKKVECPFCKEEIIEGSTKCEHCGSALKNSPKSLSTPLASTKSPSNSGIVYATISLILGIVALIDMYQYQSHPIFSKETLENMLTGGAIIIGTSLLLGLIGFRKGKLNGLVKGLAITGIVLAIVAGAYTFLIYSNYSK